MAFKDVVNNLKNAIGDLSSLTVETYTGNITADIQGAEGQGVIDWTKLVNKAKPGGIENHRASNPPCSMVKRMSVSVIL